MVDASKMAKERDKKKGDSYKLLEGETLVYVCDPGGDRDLAYYECAYHYGYSPDGKGTAICLDQKTNPIWKEESFVNALKAAGKPLPSEKDGCPVCRAFLDKQKENYEPKNRYLWVIAPWKFRQKSSQPWQPMSKEAEIFPCGWKIYNGIIDSFASCGDITAPKAAVLVKITREGTGRQTQYGTTTDLDTAKEPLRIKKTMISAIRKSIKEDKDIPKFLVQSYKTQEQMEKTLKGIDVEEDDDDDGGGGGKDEDDAAGKGKPVCFGQDFDSTDDECTEHCEHKDECAEECGVEVSKKKKKKGKKSKDEEEPTPKKKGKKAKKEEEEEEEPDEDEDDEGDEEEAENPPCFGEYEDDSDDCVGCDCKEKCEAETEDESEDEEEDGKGSDDDEEEDGDDSDEEEDSEEEDDDSAAALRKKLEKVKAKLKAKKSKKK